jgi:hypothetical protein
VKLLDRIRRFWGSEPAIDHPLSEDERVMLSEEDHAHLTYGELARTVDEFVGGDVDRDERSA